MLLRALAFFCSSLTISDYLQKLSMSFFVLDIYSNFSPEQKE